MTTVAIARERNFPGHRVGDVQKGHEKKAQGLEKKAVSGPNLRHEPTPPSEGGSGRIVPQETTVTHV
jgi:hypothetical protein